MTAENCLTTVFSPRLLEMEASKSLATNASGVSQQAVDPFDIEFSIFEEAAQMASHILQMPVCTVGIPQKDLLVLKAAIGLSQLGLMNPLARSRRLPLGDELTGYVIQEKRPLVLPEIQDCDALAQSLLVEKYGIRAYIAMPLLTTEGNCIGLLAAMDTQPREFSKEAIAFMELLARWSVSEYERHIVSDLLAKRTQPAVATDDGGTSTTASANTVRLVLMNQLTEEMRNPITTIAGMTNMLSREIYGSLTPKQREYTEIAHTSSQTMLEMANQVLALNDLHGSLESLNLATVDLEMLVQHVQKKLTPTARKNHQDVRLTVEPKSRLWQLDKDVVRQLLHHLIFGVIKFSREGGTVRAHGSSRNGILNIAVWVSHPWLGEGLPAPIMALRKLLVDPVKSQTIAALMANVDQPQAAAISQADLAEIAAPDSLIKSQETLSLLLSRYLIEHHGGSLVLQGNADSGHRFLVTLQGA